MKTKILLMLPLIILLLSSCSSNKFRNQESVMDDPKNHVSIGLNRFDEGKYEEAKKSFDLAKNLNVNEKSKACAYAALAMYYAEKKDAQKVEDNIDEAEDLNSKDPYTLILCGRAITILNKDKSNKDWYDDAEDKFDDAIEILEDKNSNDDLVSDDLAMAHYFKAMAAKYAYKFNESEREFEKVIKINRAYGEEANKEWEKVQMIARAKPGTRLGAKVALMDKVGKAEIAVLFIEELKIKEILKKREKKEYDNSFKAPEDPMKLEMRIKQAEAITDIGNHWAEAWIKDVVKSGVMEVGPDHKFVPNTPVTRAEYALMLLRVIVMISNDESLYTKHVGEDESMFPDISTSHPAYNALAICVSRGIMKANVRGEIEKSKDISGAEALLNIRELQNALQIVF